MFSVETRNRVRDRVLQLAASDTRVVAGAIVGSLAHDEGDRWSHLDLTFAVADSLPLHDVLADWTRTIVDEFDAAHLFDLPSGASIYRVFLLSLQLRMMTVLRPTVRHTSNGLAVFPTAGRLTPVRHRATTHHARETPDAGCSARGLLPSFPREHVQCVRLLTNPEASVEAAPLATHKVY